MKHLFFFLLFSWSFVFAQEIQTLNIFRCKFASKVIAASNLVSKEFLKVCNCQENPDWKTIENGILAASKSEKANVEAKILIDILLSLDQTSGTKAEVEEKIKSRKAELEKIGGIQNQWQNILENAIAESKLPTVKKTTETKSIPEPQKEDVPKTETDTKTNAKSDANFEWLLYLSLGLNAISLLLGCLLFLKHEKLKELVEKNGRRLPETNQLQSSQQNHTSVVHKNEFAALENRLKEIEKQLGNMPIQKAEPVRIPSEEVKTIVAEKPVVKEKPIEVLETIFSAGPLAEKKLSGSRADNPNQAYKIEILSNQEIQFQTLETSDFRDFVKANLEQRLMTVCEFENRPGQKFSLIQTIKPGKLKREGPHFLVIEKAKVIFVE